MPLGTAGRRETEELRHHQGVELRLHGEDNSEDSDDGVEEVECEGETKSFQNFLQQQKRDT